MTNEEVADALRAGKTRFVTKRSGRVYIIDPAQEEIVRCPDDDVLLIGHPETLSPRMSMRRYRGRKWAWLAPKNLTLAPPKDQK